MVSKRSFLSVFSSLSIVGGALTLAPSVFAACPQTDPGALTHHPARTPTNSCVQADINALHAFVDDPANANATWADLETSMTAQHAGCSTCVFSNAADANWGPAVKNASGTAMVNYGACLEKAAGGSVTCGGTYQKASACVNARCAGGAGLCTTQTDQDNCINTVLTDATSCGQYDYETDCPNFTDLTDPGGACEDFFAVITVMCSASGGVDAGPGPGVDAGPKDGGPVIGKKDAGPAKKDAAPTGDDDDTTGDDDDDTTGTDDASTKKPTTKKSDAGAAEDDSSGSDSSSGCAQSGSTAGGGTVASALGLMFAVGSVIRSRRRRSKR